MISVRQATFLDIHNFKISEADNLESWSVSRLTGKEALKHTVSRSAECYVALENSKTICLFGCIPEGKGAGFWLLIPAGIEQLPLSFFRQAKPVIDELLERYDYLRNYAHPSKRFIIKLSKWLGFTVSDLQPYGHDGELFHCVYKRR